MPLWAGLDLFVLKEPAELFHEGGEVRSLPQLQQVAILADIAVVFRISLDGLQQVFPGALEAAVEAVGTGGVVIVEVELVFPCPQNLLGHSGLAFSLVDSLGELEDLLVGLYRLCVIADSVVEIGELEVRAQSHQGSLVVDKLGIPGQLFLYRLRVSEYCEDDSQLFSKPGVEEQIPIELSKSGDEILVPYVRQRPAAAEANAQGARFIVEQVEQGLDVLSPVRGQLIVLTIERELGFNAALEDPRHLLRDDVVAGQLEGPGDGAGA